MLLNLREKLKTLLKLNLLLLILVLLNLLPSCSTDKTLWAPTVYSGSSENVGVERSQASEKISCSDKKFDEMFCMFDRDLKLLIDRCLKEKESGMTWKLHEGE